MNMGITTAEDKPVGEKAYIRHHTELLSQLWIGRIIVLAATMWIFFALPDYYHSKELLFKILPYRASIILFLIIAFFMNKISRNNTYQYILSVATVAMCTLTVTVICLSYSNHKFIHLLAFILIIISGLGFVPMNTRRSILMVVVVYGFYVVPFVIFGKVQGQDQYVFFLINIYLGAATIMMFILRITHEENLIRGLKLQYQLEGTITLQSSRVKTSEMMLKHLVDNASEGIAIIDNRGMILDANRKFYEMHGKEQWEEIVNRHITDIYAGSDNEETMKKKMALLSREPSVLFEMTLKGEEKEERAVEIAVTSINVDNDSVFLAFYRDITERKLLYQQLAHAQKMESLGNLACGISHDFKNLLGTVLGYVDLIRCASDGMENRTTFETIKSNTDMIGHEVRRAKEILSNLLNIGSAGRDTDYRVLDLTAIIKTSRDVYSNLFPNIIIEIDLCEGLPAVVGSGSHIEQVLSNLYMNSKDAMPSGGNIRITTEVTRKAPFVLDMLKEKTAEDYVLVSFSDTGIGISDENLPHIFEPFYTLKKSSDTSVSGGTGLGLAMVYGIIKEHKGMITVQSKVARGTTFHIYFPSVATLSPATK